MLISPDLSNGREPLPVACVNELGDGARRPRFVYITANRPTVAFLAQQADELLPPRHCDCVDGDCTSSVACACRSPQLDAAGRLTRQLYGEEMLTECDASCACSACANRTPPLRHRLRVVRTAALGWALQTDEDIGQGEHVARYVGELIADEEVREREDSYFYDVGDNVSRNTSPLTPQTHTVDARRYGNALRFANHSCAPNISPVVVRSADGAQLNLCFFALRNIDAHEQLT